MQHIRRLLSRFRQMHRFSKFAARLGVCLMLVYYIIAVGCRIGAVHYTEHYFYLMGLSRGCLEAAPAVLAASMCAALIGDLVLNRHRADDEE